jgi:hypothetical protein
VVHVSLPALRRKHGDRISPYAELFTVMRSSEAGRMKSK